MEDKPLPFLDHVEELRTRLIRCLIALAVTSVAAYQVVDWVIAQLALPVGRFIFLHPTEAVFVRLKIALGLGTLLAAPYLLYQIWKFVLAALTPLEMKAILWLLPAAYLLFVMGAAFGFFVLVPAGVKFLLAYQTPVLTATIALDQYVSFVSVMCLIQGLVFEMPLVSYFGARFGLVQAAWLSEKRRMAVLVLYILSAFLTPGPDPVTAFLLFVPTYILFELSIWTARWGNPF